MDGRRPAGAAGLLFDRNRIAHSCEASLAWHTHEASLFERANPLIYTVVATCSMKSKQLPMTKRLYTFNMKISVMANIWLE